MAFPLPRGITPPEISFLAEMEMVTVVPRQRLEGLELLGVSFPCRLTLQANTAGHPDTVESLRNALALSLIQRQPPHIR
jgi:hypothetical protein